MAPLAALYEKMVRVAGENNAQIFQVHQMMLDDDDYNDSIINMICSQQLNAEYVVTITGKYFTQMFTQADDDYIRARSTDVKDISERVVGTLGNIVEKVELVEDPCHSYDRRSDDSVRFQCLPGYSFYSKNNKRN